MDDALFLCAKNVGIAVVNADLKDKPDGVNETKVLMGEPVEILAYVMDGKWLKIRTSNYEGYVQRKNIGKCSIETLIAYCKSEKFAVIKEYFDLNERTYRMGSRFPLCRRTEKKVECLIPSSVFGMFFMEKKWLPLDCIHDGYMEYSRNNILNLAYGGLGRKYGWGDEGEGMDCSSYVCGIFRCMGIFLPRNVSQMLEMNYPSENIAGRSFEEVIKALEHFGAGCLLLTKAHVMVYEGIQNGKPVFLHCSNRMGGYCMKSEIGPYKEEVQKIILV